MFRARELKNYKELISVNTTGSSMSGPANKEVRIVSSHRDWETVSFLRY
jgi:hypothetical protein